MMHSFGHWWGVGPLSIVAIGTIGLFFILLALAILFLKGYSLWHAAKRGEKWWFIALLIINTAGILELIYIIFILKKWPGKEAPRTDSGNTTSNPPIDSNSHIA